MPTPPMSDELLRETVQLWRDHNCRATEAAQAIGINPKTFDSRLQKARARGFLLSDGARGVVEMAGLSGAEARGGWLHSYDADGKKVGATYWKAEEVSPADLKDTIADALAGITPLPPIDAPERVEHDLCNFLPIADLHFGGEYGRPEYEAECTDTVDRTFAAMPRAQKTYVIDLGDTTDANDHLGLTPGGKNPIDVIRHGLQGAIWTAVRFLKHTTYRALETSQEVEVHVLRGNHSETSYLSVLIGMTEHFRDNPRVTIHVPGEGDIFRVLRWGKCGVMPDHGDKMKWSDLKDVWNTAFAQDWVECTAYRGVWTAHHHKEKSADLAGVECRQFRTMSASSRWAKMRFPAVPRGQTGITLHREEGFDGMAYKTLKPLT